MNHLRSHLENTTFKNEPCKNTEQNNWIVVWKSESGKRNLFQNDFKNQELCVKNCVKIMYLKRKYKKTRLKWTNRLKWTHVKMNRKGLLVNRLKNQGVTSCFFGSLRWNYSKARTRQQQRSVYYNPSANEQERS